MRSTRSGGATARPSSPSLARIVPVHRAEDVAQDALVKAYRSLPRADEDLNLRPWLYTIVRNTALNDLRDERVDDSTSPRTGRRPATG